MASNSGLNVSRVDSAGYPATRITGTTTDLRELTGAGGTYARTENPYTNGAIHRKLTGGSGSTSAVSALSDSSGYVYDSEGNPLYYYRPDDGSTPDVDEALLGDRVRVLPAHWTPKIPDTQRYYYDEEVIEISHDAGLSLELKSNGLQINASGTTLTERLTGAHSSATDLTTSANAGSASITLICEASDITTASRDITIKNATADTDYPPGHIAIANSGMSEEIGKLVVLVRSTPTLDDGTLPTAKNIERIDALFDALFGAALPAAGQKTIVYEVVTGNGTLYTEVNSTPKTTLQAHQALEAYINMNNTTNLVAAYILGSPDTRKR